MPDHWEVCHDNWRLCNECGRALYEGEDILHTTPRDSDLPIVLCGECADKRDRDTHRRYRATATSDPASGW